jgi:hypothetical protein
MKKDLAEPSSYRPLVAIGHTKDLIDVGAMDAFLAFLREKGIPVTTLSSAGERIASQGRADRPSL